MEEEHMAENKFRACVNELQDHDLFVLHREVMEALYNRGHVARPQTLDEMQGVMHNHQSMIPLPSENVPSSPTLQGSNRPSFQLSLYSSETASLETHATNQSNSRSVFRSDYVEHNVTSHVTSPDKAQLNEEQPATANNTIPSPQPVSADASKPFFCTFCAELGTHSPFGTKYDWIRHEQNFHQTGCEWHCRFEGCLEVFERKQDAKRHVRKEHVNRGQVVPEPPYREISLQQTQLFACGFKHCGKISATWKDRCNHVSECMREKGAEWSYTRKIRALLKHQNISRTWKIVKAHWCHELGIDASALEWDPKRTRFLRQQLECLSFDAAGLKPLLENLFRLGHPQNKGFSRYPLTATPPSFYPASSHHFNSVSPALGHPTMSYDSQRVLQDQQYVHKFYGTSALINASQHRDSMMIDAPSIASFDFASLQPDEEAPPPEEDLIGVNELLLTGVSGYAANPTPPLPDQCVNDSFDSPPKSPKPSPARRLMRRSRTVFSSKRSQDFRTPADPTLTQHPQQPTTSQSNSAVPNPFPYSADVSYNFPS
ncbi:hypothetical protein P154DRAFT_145476 [Amniculicola lignicola CBS 123094]|uniref:C2H2-type domain-containing protein n=1 Tax=Amniculicola lignicola CBS 123094 TaxID=1392246 RepID=A0A6A5WKW8_9PLEO|nr:hypothetical protein P154DRAFT_145476 [Amniculicola lignicola CBS 123094]